MSLDRRLQMIIARAVITAVDDARLLQALQLELLDDERLDGAEHFQAYGLTSVPHPGAEAVAVFPNGTRSHGLVIAVGDRRYRLRGLEAGEVALHDDQGQKILLKRDGIAIESAFAITIDSDAEVTVRAPVATIEADTVHLGGEGGAAVARVGDSVAGGVITSGSSKVKAA